MKMQKKQYKIGELAHLLEIKQFVVRFWEKEFNIKPCRSTGGHRFYTDHHVEKFSLIKTLLYDKKFTLEGAKKELKNSDTHNQDQNIIPSHRIVSPDEPVNKDFTENILQLKKQLIRLKELL